jgi:hypothetical protein
MARSCCWSASSGYKFLPLSALPEVDYPTIQVQTFYPGASPEVMTSSVTAPLERQFGQMPGLKQMSSTARPAPRSSRCSSIWPQPRHRRAGSAGGDQRGGNLLPQTCRRRRSTPRSIRPTRRS